MTPRFSIIIPVYNVAPYLRECLDSVLAQTYEDWEAICVDDGSTDGSGAILDECGERDARFHVVHKRNEGVAVARNCALDIAKGEWIWFVDGDDLARPEALEYFWGKINTHSEIDLLALKDFIRAEKLSVWPELVTGEEWSTHGAKEYLAFHNGACNVVFRRSFLDGLRIEHFAIGEDVLFFAILFWRARQLLVVDVPLYFYRQRPTGASMGNVSMSAVRDNLEIERRCLELIKVHKEEWNDDDFKLYFMAHRHYLMLTNMGKFMRISDAERTQILSVWLAVQRLAIELGENTRYLKSSVFILSFIPSGWLARKLVEFIIWSRNRSIVGFMMSAVRTIRRGLKRIVS